MRKALIETIQAALIDALRYNGGSVNLAACELMIGRVTLYRKIKDLKFRSGSIRHNGEEWFKIRNPRYSQYEGRREFFEKKRAIVAVQNGRH